MLSIEMFKTDKSEFKDRLNRELYKKARSVITSVQREQGKNIFPEISSFKDNSQRIGH